MSNKRKRNEPLNQTVVIWKNLVDMMDTRDLSFHLFKLLKQEELDTLCDVTKKIKKRVQEYNFKHKTFKSDEEIVHANQHKIRKLCVVHTDLVDFSPYTNLTHLHFLPACNQQVKNLPKTLRYVYFSTSYNHPLPVLPKQLLYLGVPNRRFNNVILCPDNLWCLELGSGFDKEENLVNVPKSLKKIQLNESLWDRIKHKKNMRHIQEVKLWYYPPHRHAGRMSSGRPIKLSNWKQVKEAQ